MTEGKHPGGRPTKYDPKYCQMLIDHMGSGLSFESFAPTIGVCRFTVYEWEKVYPEFSDAKKEGSDKNLLFWEKNGIEGLWDETEYENGKPVHKKALNTTLWIFNMKNRHRWRDKQDEEIAKINIGGLSREELIEKAKEALRELESK